MPGTAHPHRPADAPDEYAYVATTPIDVWGVRGYNTGDPVPASVVKSLELATSGAEQTVAKVGTKAADAVVPQTAP